MSSNYELMKWPPRSNFSLLPAELQPWINLADTASTWLNFKSPAETDSLYAPYIAELNQKVDTAMQVIKPLEPDTDGAFEAAIGLFTVMAHQYRWKHVPVLQEQRDVRQMDFPPCIYEPLHYITQKAGLPLGGAVYALVCCNYDSERDGARFVFNTVSPEVMKTEKGWTKMLWTFEEKSAPFLQELVELCKFLDEAKEGDRWTELEDRVAEKLRNVKTMAGNVFRVLHEFDSKGLISSKYFATYIEGPHGWGIDGIGGASGAQMLPVVSLDAMLSIKGEGMMYRETVRSRESMTRKAREFLSILDDHAALLRAHYGHVSEFIELVRMVYNFRLGHRKIGIRYLDTSEGTAGGKIQLNETKDGHEMVHKFKREMGVRIKENSDYIDELAKMYGPPPPGMLSAGGMRARRASMPVLQAPVEERKRAIVGLGIPDSRKLSDNAPPKRMLRRASDAALNLMGNILSFVPMASFSDMGSVMSFGSSEVGGSSTVLASKSASADIKPTTATGRVGAVLATQSEQELIDTTRRAFAALLDNNAGAIDPLVAQKLRESHQALLDALLLTKNAANTTSAMLARQQSEKMNGNVRRDSDNNALPSPKPLKPKHAFDISIPPIPGSPATARSNRLDRVTKEAALKASNESIFDALVQEKVPFKMAKKSAKKVRELLTGDDSEEEIAETSDINMPARGEAMSF